MNVHVARIVPGQAARHEERVLLDAQSHAFSSIDGIDARDDVKEILRFVSARVTANATMKLFHYRTIQPEKGKGVLLHFLASAFGPSLEIVLSGAVVALRSSGWQKEVRLPVAPLANRRAFAATVDEAVDAWLGERFALARR